MNPEKNTKYKINYKKFLPFVLGILLLVAVVSFLVFRTPGEKNGLSADISSAYEERYASELRVMGRTYGAVTLDGVVVASLRTYEEALQVKDAVIAHYQTAGSTLIEAEIEEEIEVREVIGAAWGALSVDGAVSLLVNGTEEVKTYTVEKGDTMYGIAAKVGMTYSELIAANPTSTPNKLSIGQVLNIVEVKPMVHVHIRETVTVTESVAYSTTYEGNSDLYVGEYKVKSAGKKGQNSVTYDVVSNNGVTESKTKTGSEVISAPVTQVTYKGTKPLPDVIGTGVFMNPLDEPLIVTSGYNTYRTKFGWHYGVDFSKVTGSNIYAVDDGVVTFSGTSGNYGNLVKLSHGNGYETYYGHCSQLLVSIGDTVKKGDVIALVGSTGRSTGPHLHFEVRVNGVTKNPLNYLP